jgi:PAS domain S-box-containing protein
MEVTETTEQAVARTLADVDDLTEAYPRVLRIVGERLGWAWAAAWEPGAHGQPPLRCVAAWGADDALEPFEAVSHSLALDAGEGLPGRVWEAREPAWVVDVVADTNFPRARTAASLGLHAALCFPARSARGCVAVVELLATEPREPDEELLRTLSSLGDQIGLAIERRRAHQAAHVGDQRTRAMLEAALDAVIAIDHRGHILDFNPAAERTFGYAAEDVLGKDMADLIVPPSLRRRHRAGLARYLVTGEGPVLDRRVEITGMRADGSEFPVELTITRSTSPARLPSPATSATSPTASSTRPSCAPRARGSSKPPTRRADGSSAIFMTARSSGWSGWRSTCGSRAIACSTTPRPLRACSRRRPRSSRAPPPSCASWRGASTLRS